MADESHDALISQFTGIIGAPTSVASQILQVCSWNLDEAVRFFFETQTGDPLDAEPDSEPENDMSSDDTGANAPSQPGRSSQPSRQQNNNNQPRLRTLRDLQSGSAADDSDGEDENKQDFFAGGEKSALAVQNPNNQHGGGGGGDHFNNIMNQARQNRPRPGGEDEPPATSSNFSGRAQTLGGDDAPSQTVGDTREPTASRRSTLPRVTRNLHLWSDGFSVDDGELYRFDDPANAPTLALINQGRAPLALLGVEAGQEVDLQLIPHKDEQYVQPKKKYKPFEGQGQRLGSPTPGPSGVTETASIAQASTAQTSSSNSAAASQAPTVSVDEDQPTVTIQVRLGDGTRLSSRFNTSHTIGDIYDFVGRAHPASAARSWVLMTTFPSKELSDKSTKLEDMSDFKRGGVVVQKWT